jgi:hypothetical protein
VEAWALAALAALVAGILDFTEVPALAGPGPGLSRGFVSLTGNLHANFPNIDFLSHCYLLTLPFGFPTGL